MARRIDENRLYRLIGQRIAAQRRMARISQEALAERTQVLTRATIANVERGRQRVAVHQLYLLADALGVEPAELLAGRDEVAATPKLGKTPDERAWLQAVFARTTTAGRRGGRGDAQSRRDRPEG